MKKIKIKCRVVDNLNPRMFYIYNLNNKSCDKTDIFGEKDIYLEENKTYNLVIRTIGYNPISVVLYVTKKLKCLSFYFQKNKYHTITIIFKDKNYDNLKIERGIIYLCQDHIQ